MASRGSVEAGTPTDHSEAARRTLEGRREQPTANWASDPSELLDVLDGAEVGSLVELLADQRYLKPDWQRRPIFRVTGMAHAGQELVINVEASRHQYELRMEIEPELRQPTARCIEAPQELFVDDVVDVDAARVIDTGIDWPVISRGASKIYHRPDPIALAFDEARPACVDEWGSRGDREYRIAASSVLGGHYHACISCFRAPRTVGYDTFDCSECGTSLTRLALQGPKAEAVDGIVVECPSCGALEIVALDG